MLTLFDVIKIGEKLVGRPFPREDEVERPLWLNDLNAQLELILKRAEKRRAELAGLKEDSDE